jgi:hypothetical protein
LYRS